MHALKEKHRFPEHLQEENYTDDDELLIKALSFNDTGKKGPEDFITFLVSNNNIQTHFGANITENIRKVMTRSSKKSVRSRKPRIRKHKKRRSTRRKSVKKINTI